MFLIFYFSLQFINNIHGLSEKEDIKLYSLDNYNPKNCNKSFYITCKRFFDKNNCYNCYTVKYPQCRYCFEQISNLSSLKSIDIPIKFMNSIETLPIQRLGSEDSEYSTSSSNSESISDETTYFSTKFTTNGETNFEKLINESIIHLANSSIVGINQNYLIAIDNLHIYFFDLNFNLDKLSFKHNLQHPCVYGIIFNEKIAIGDCLNQTLIIWYINNLNQEPNLIVKINQEFSYLAVLLNGDLAIAWNTSNYEIVIFDSYKGSIKKTFIGHTDKISQILQRNDEYIVSSSIDNCVIIWDLSGNPIKIIKYEESIFSIAISDYFLAAGLANNQIKVINLKNGKVIGSLNNFSVLCRQQCLHFLDDLSILSASLDQTLKIWNPDYVTLNSTIAFPSNYVEQVFQKNGFLMTKSKTEIIRWKILF